MRVMEDQRLTAPTNALGDGWEIWGGDGPVILRRCVVDFSAHPVAALDEAISGIRGAWASLYRVGVYGAGKAILWGNGDYPAEDAAGAHLYMEECVIRNVARRGPEAQDGARVHMRRCWVHGWGVKDRFDGCRTFGAWAHDGASITAEECLFTQDGFWQPGPLNMAVDMANHVGEAVNRRGLFGLTRRDFRPGVMRGLTASDGGSVTAVNCWTSHPWIVLEGAQGRMPDAAAAALMEHLGRVVPS